MNVQPPPDHEEIQRLIKENKTLKRRLERMAKETRHLGSLHDQAMKLRDFSEREKVLQYEYNNLLLENAPDMIFILDPEMRFRLGTKVFIHFLGRKHAGTLLGAPLETLFAGTMPDGWIDSTRDVFESVIDERRQMQYNNEVSLESGRKVFSISVAPAIASSGQAMGVICLMHDSTELVRMKEAAETATRAKSSFLASMSHEIRTPLTLQQKAYTGNIINAVYGLTMIIDDILDFSKIEANRYEIMPVTYNLATELYELCSLMQPKADEKGLAFIVDIDPDLPQELIGDNLRIRQILVNIINNAVKFTPQGEIILSVYGESVSEDEWELVLSVSDSGQGIRQEELPKIFQSFEQADFYKNKNIAGTGLGLAISKNLAELMGGNISAASQYGVGSEFTIFLPQKAVGKNVLARVEAPERLFFLVYLESAPMAGRLADTLEKLRVKHCIVTDKTALVCAARQGAPTHVLIDGDAALAQDAAVLCPRARVACLISAMDVEALLPDGVQVLWKPLLVVGLAAFLNGEDSIFEDGKLSAGRLGSLSFPDARVLIVDDNEINLIVASELVKTFDIRPETARSGAEAIKKVKNGSYDLIFMDHMMPEMDGLEAAAAIRAMDIAQPVLIALTANAIVGMEKIYRQNGFDGYITKPIDVDNLTATLEKWLGQ